MRNPKNVLESLALNACKQNYKYERLYRNLYNREFYLLAYSNIYAKEGNLTEGTDGKTIDGMGINRIDKIIEKMRNHSYNPAPARRTYIKKSNGKLRPLGIPSFDDKLVQEVIRMILECIYEPTFLKTSHGFRPMKSCHTALKHVQKNFTGVKWFVEGDIKGCFDNIDHHILMNIVRRRINDEYFISILWKFLKAGYIDNWVYYKTYSGTPQGSIISPILANIYLHELDCFIEKYKRQFNHGKKRETNPVYKNNLYKCKAITERLKRNKGKLDENERAEMITKIKEYKQVLRNTPYGDPMDKDYRRLVYVRYADDFLIGVIGSKDNAIEIKNDVGNFLKGTLNLEMSEEKTLITHGNKFAKFLSYNVTTSTEQNMTKVMGGYTRRSYTGRVKLYVPKEKWMNRLVSYHALKIEPDKHNDNKEMWEPTRRPELMRLDDLEILNQYNGETRGLYNYYRLAHNATVLNNYIYVMKYSMYKTFAGKYRTSMRKIIKKYRHGKDFGIEYVTRKGRQLSVFYNKGAKRDNEVVYYDNPDIVSFTRENKSMTSLIQRLQAQICENCGASTSQLEVHHVRKLKDLKGKKAWEQQMIARKRKTLILCSKCHKKLHAGKLD